jgi:hypothetical protein
MSRMSISKGNRRSRSPAEAQAGGVVVSVLVVLVVAAAVLGWNYQRNYERDQSVRTSDKPYAKYQTKDLDLMAEGYRIALAEAKSKQSGERVGTQNRHHFADKIQEFERVQRATRIVRDQAIAVKEVQDTLAQIEAEQLRRNGFGGVAMIHLERLFRI